MVGKNGNKYEAGGGVGDGPAEAFRTHASENRAPVAFPRNEGRRDHPHALPQSPNRGIPGFEWITSDGEINLRATGTPLEEKSYEIDGIFKSIKKKNG